ncbi:hypothetical protein I0E51_17615 [Pseudomonas lalucatii]|nr:hypothetical protein [Pseudomonas lalucatii]
MKPRAQLGLPLSKRSPLPSAWPRWASSCGVPPANCWNSCSWPTAAGSGGRLASRCLRSKASSRVPCSGWSSLRRTGAALYTSQRSPIR